MAVTTLRQVQNRLNRIATAHLQINEFFWGPVYDFATSGTTNYPAMLVDIAPNSVFNDVLTKVNLIIHIADKERAGETNRDDIVSDCLQIAKDVMAEIKHPGWAWDVDEKADVRFEHFIYDEKDILAGIIFYPTIKLVSVDDTCQIPMGTILRDTSTSTSGNYPNAVDYVDGVDDGNS